MNANKNILFIWATPRSVSTAFEKALSRSPSVGVIHEPFANCYYYGPDRRSSRYGRISGRLAQEATGDKVSTFIKLEADRLTGNRDEATTIVVKELGFQGSSYVSSQLLSESTHLVLLRDPRLVYSSLSRIKAEFDEEEFGFSKVREMVKRIARLTGVKPKVYDGTAFQNAPDLVLKEVCRENEIKYVESMTCWTDGKIRNWSKEEELSQKRWHTTLESSKGVIPATTDPNSVAVSSRYKQMVDNGIAIYNELLGR